MEIRINLIKGLDIIDGRKELYLDLSDYPFIPKNTITIKKVLSKYICYNWQAEKIGCISKSDFDMLWGIEGIKGKEKPIKEISERTEEDYLKQGQWE